MQLNTLKAKSSRVTSMRVGRGGKRGKTSGRGGKGQTARAGHKIRPEIRDRIKKLPKRRGYGKNRSRTVRSDRTNYSPVNLSALEALFTSGDTINAVTLARKGLIRGKGTRAKILGMGELTKSFSVSDCIVSASAKAAIEKAGGSVLTHA